MHARAAYIDLLVWVWLTVCGQMVWSGVRGRCAVLHVGWALKLANELPVLPDSVIKSPRCRGGRASGPLASSVSPFAQFSPHNSIFQPFSTQFC